MISAGRTVRPDLDESLRSELESSTVSGSIMVLVQVPRTQSLYKLDSPLSYQVSVALYWLRLFSNCISVSRPVCTTTRCKPAFGVLIQADWLWNPSVYLRLSGKKIFVELTRYRGKHLQISSLRGKQLLRNDIVRKNRFVPALVI